MEAALVSHPHAAAFANGVAAAFERRRKLALYVSGVVTSRKAWSGQILNQIARANPVILNRIISGVPPRRVHSLAPVELAARFMARAFGTPGSQLGSSYDTMFSSHDAAVERMEWPRRTDMVYAYEDAALRTFVRAARRGLTRVWDLPLPHYSTLEQMWQVEVRRWPEAHGSPSTPVEPDWKKRRKDAELGLASAVSVASSFTRQSLEKVGVKVPIVVTPYGFPVEGFQAKRQQHDGPFTVLAVGTQDLRKGTPYLLEAWKKAGLKDARLRIVGRMNLSADFVGRYASLFEHIPHVPNADLGDIYRNADVLVFPTLGDGYGLVIQESMSCGTPVITTPCGGGPESITDGENGWIIPPRDVDTLLERLRFAAGNRDALFRAGQAARARAEQWTWRHSGEALLRSLSKL